MIKNHFYNKKLKGLARILRNNPTKAEKRLWYNLLSNGNFLGHKFLRQRPIDNYIVDFYCKELRLAIEVDGAIHEFEEIREKDLIKDSRLKELGIQVLRVSNWEVFNDLALVQEIIYRKIQEISPTNPPSGEAT